jgi:hypothetical protein
MTRPLPPHDSSATTMVDARLYNELLEHADRLAEVLRIIRSVEDNDELRNVLVHVLDRYDQARANAPR